MGKSSAKSATEPEPNILTKHRVVLGLQEPVAEPIEGQFADFVIGEEGGTDVHLVLPAEVWDHMGRPETVTVTVRPGDHLNPEA